ncbi:Calcium release-activated calcium channel protein 1 [Orchesella cincta]|uniref:Calcium release-activated calcium channel protein 1 n=1 Tax=Orchesella cincta TaxID=48709 RepID=A0A1D2MLD5_ORCCI|nr:Calcium release-activated calcium channel protein 1 [Orchesella cincta]
MFAGYGSTPCELNSIGVATTSTLNTGLKTISINSLAQPPTNKEEKPTDYLAWRRLQVSKAKLSGVGEIATFLAGFAVATVELQINDDANPFLLLAFTVTTALLVCTTMMSIMISTCILPHVIVVAKVGHPNAQPHESPHDQMRFFIDLSWVLANTISIFLFTLDVILLCWIKYTYFSFTASVAATAIMIPVLLGILVFGIIFYRNVIQHQSAIVQMRYDELEEMKRRIDSVQTSTTSLAVTYHV